MSSEKIDLKLRELVTLEISVFDLGIINLGVSCYLEKLKSDSLVNVNVRDLYDQVNEFYKHLSDFYLKVWYEKN